MNMCADTGQTFHDQHECFTEKAYNTSGLLPDRYVIVLTNACNLRCPFCFQDKRRQDESLNLDDWLEVVRQIPDYGRITLTGGEPLLFKGFKELFERIAQRVDCNIITNGILLNEELIDFFLSFDRFKVLSISIDNVGNTLRGIDEKKWANVERMVRYFIRKRDNKNSTCILDIKTLILDENSDDLYDIRRYCVEHLGCDHQVFQFLKGSPVQHADHMFPLEAIHHKATPHVYKKFDRIKYELEKIRQYNVNNQKTAFLHPKIASLTSESPLPDMDYINSAGYDPNIYQPCKFPWASVHINYDGSLFPCLAVSMGNVKTESLAHIVNGEAFSRFKDIIREQGSVEACARCGWLRPLP